MGEIKIICDYFSCNEPIRFNDLKFTPPTKRYCKEHGSECDEAIDKGAKHILKFWVKAGGGAKQMAKYHKDIS